MPTIAISDSCRHAPDDNGNCSECHRVAIWISKEGYTCLGCGEYMMEEKQKDCCYDKAVNPSLDKQAQCNCCNECRQLCFREALSIGCGLNYEISDN